MEMRTQSVLSFSLSDPTMAVMGVYTVGTPLLDPGHWFVVPKVRIFLGRKGGEFDRVQGVEMYCLLCPQTGPDYRLDRAWSCSTTAPTPRCSSGRAE